MWRVEEREKTTQNPQQLENRTAQDMAQKQSAAHSWPVDSHLPFAVENDGGLANF